MFTIGFEVAGYVRVKKNYFGGQCPSFISGSGITWDQPQFYLFSYILSNGCRYALPAGMLFGKGNEHSAWSQARVFSCLRLDLGERATPIPLPLTWTTESATAYLNHIFSPDNTLDMRTGSRAFLRQGNKCRCSCTGYGHKEPGWRKNRNNDISV